MTIKETKDVVMAGEEEELMPFMDTFYSLAADDAAERSFAASSMIKHVFISYDGEEGGIDATVKDGCYALTRLMNGLCSGRASARQGFASCLASFLKMSFKLGPGNDSDKCWMDLFMKNLGEQSDIGPAEFVRKLLLQSTNLEAPAKGQKNVGKRSRSEERDHRFGRLFGILAVVRSGTLADASQKDLQGYVSDLLNLYDHKNWFQEPAIHALKELFSAISVSFSMHTIGHLLQGSMVSFFNFEQKATSPWSVEKIALYLHLQTIYMDKGESELPKCLKNALLTKSNLDKDIGGGVMKIMLRDTSVTVYPKCHMVWSAVWSYLSEPVGSDKSTKKKKSKTDKRVLREKLIVGGDSSSEIIEALVNKVIAENLLGDDAGEGFVSATHGRRALGLSLLQQMCKLSLPSIMLEDVVLQQSIVTNLFVNTLQKFSAGKKMHTLKPLALDILQSIVDSLCSQELTEENVQRRIGASKAFLRANPSFDSVTKTETVSLLLGLGMGDKNGEEDDAETNGRELLWEGHFQFVMEEILRRLSCSDPVVQEANKYVDIMFAFVKRILRVGTDSERQALFKRTLSFFMVGAFFNVSDYDNSDMDEGSSSEVLLNAASQIKENVGSIPYATRVVMSARFFSLISDYLNASASQQSGEAKENAKDRKINIVLDEVSFVYEGIRILQNHGAALFNEIKDDGEEMDGETISPVLGAMKACERMKDLAGKAGESGAKSIACLASTLSLQLLHPGQHGSDGDKEVDVDDDEDDISEEVLEIISDLSEVVSALAGESNDDDEEEGNLLSSLAAIFVGILNSTTGGSGLQASSVRGGASKITRECLQLAWTTTLSSSSDSSNIVLDADVMSTLLEAVCSPKALAQGKELSGDEDMEDSDDESDEGSDDESDDMGMSFSKANSAGIAVDDEDVARDGKQEKDDDADSDNSSEQMEDDIELDPSKLENLLIQDSDDDESVILEHHEGADAALAQLIKMKQDARKTGRDQNEKLELAKRLRCIGLLESVFMSHKRASLLSNQVALMAILPLLRSRSELVKSASSVTIKKKGSSANDKKALLDKITVLLENKVCKTPLDGMANVESCRTVAEQVMGEIRRIQDAEHCKCCSALLVLLVKAVAKQGDEAVTLARSIYDEAVEEWSTKKSTKIQASMFDDLVNRCQR